MTEKIRESMSALMDEEVSEIELHRLLRQFGKDSPSSMAIKNTWISFQQIRTVIRGEHSIAASRHLELHNRISAAIKADKTEFTQPVRRREGSPKQWYKPAAGLAVAASVVVAVLVSFNTPQESTEAVADISIVEVETTPTVDLRDAPIPEPFQRDLRELDEEKQKRLRQYLNRHERNVRMSSNTRTVVYEQPSSKD